MESREIKTDKNVAKAIARTIAFFDLFSYPLTGFEVWKYLDVKCELAEVLEVLENIAKKSPLVPLFERGQVERKNGFYFLAGREEIIKERMARYNYSDKKFKRAVWLSRIFKFIPWIKMIAVGNIIGAHNLKKESDIDLFIITEKNRVWLTRLFCVLIIKILGLRPKPENMRDKICLSFFISEEAMDLEKLMLSCKISRDSTCLAGRRVASLQNDRMEKDIYFIYWLAGLVPIYNRDNIYNKFIGANNWLKNYLPNWERGEVNYRRDAGKGFSRFYRDVVDMFFGGLERRTKNLELKMMPEQLKSIVNKDTRVVADKGVIKLHVNDRREEYKNKLKAKNEELKAVL